MGSPVISFCLSVKRRNHQQVCKCSDDSLEPFFVSLCPCYRPSFQAPCNCFKAGLTHQLTQNAPNAKDHDRGAPWQLLNSHSHWPGAPQTWHEAGTSTHVPPLPHRNREREMGSRPDCTIARGSGCTVHIQKLHQGANSCCSGSPQPSPTFTALPYSLQALFPSPCSKHSLGPDCQQHQLRLGYKTRGTQF